MFVDFNFNPRVHAYFPSFVVLLLVVLITGEGGLKWKIKRGNEKEKARVDCN